MKLTETVIAWNRDSDDIRVGPWPDETGWTEAYEIMVGANDPVIHRLSPVLLITATLIYFNRAVVVDGIGVKAAHAAFFELESYWSVYRVDPDGTVIGKLH